MMFFFAAHEEYNIGQYIYYIFRLSNAGCIVGTWSKHFADHMSCSNPNCGVSTYLLFAFCCIILRGYQSSIMSYLFQFRISQTTLVQSLLFHCCKVTNSTSSWSQFSWLQSVRFMLYCFYHVDIMYTNFLSLSIMFLYVFIYYSLSTIYYVYSSSHIDKYSSSHIVQCIYYV